MAVTYISSASANTTSVSLPSFQAGDLAIAIALEITDSAAAPTPPSGWNPILEGKSNTAGSVRAAYRILQSGDTTTGTWTGVEAVGVAVFRGTHTGSPIDINTTATNLYTISNGTVAGVSNDPSPNGPTTDYYLFMSIGDGSTVSSISGTGWSLQNGTGTRLCVAESTSTWATVSATYNTTADMGGIAVGIRAPSTFPVISDADTTTGTVTSNSTDWTLTYPTNIAAGDLLLALVAHDGDQTTVTWPAGWVGGGYSNGANNGVQYAKKSATGSESGTFSLTLSDSEQGAWVIYRIPAGTWEGTIGSWWFNGSQDGAVTIERIGGADATPNPPSLDPYNWNVENTLWLAVVGVDTSRTVTDHSNWDGAGFFAYADYVSGGANGATLAVARLESAAASLDPGTITISSSDDWVGATFAIQPASSATNYKVSANAQTKIKATANVSANSQAQIKQIYKWSANARTQIKQTYSSFAQAQASILSAATITYAHSQSLALIGRTDLLYSAIDEVKPYGTVYISDTFERTEGTGWGTADTGGTWTTLNASELSVSNGLGRFVTVAAEAANAEITGTTFGNSEGKMRWSVDSLTGTSTVATLRLHTRSQNAGADSIRIEIRHIDTGDLNLLIRKTVSGVGPTTINTNDGYVTGYTANQWATIRWQTLNFGPELLIRYKIWLDGTNEPSSWYEYTTSNIDAVLLNNGSFEMVAQDNGGATKNWSIDNLLLAAPDTDYIVSPNTTDYVEVMLGGTNTPDYLIEHYVNYSIAAPSGNLTVELRQGASTSIASWAQSSGQAVYSKKLSAGQIASITDYSDLRLRFTPANATRMIVYWAELDVPSSLVKRNFGQAQANIKQTYRGFGQARTSIKQTYSGFGQARPRIKQTYNGYGQAQTMVKQSYQGYAQARTSIKQSYQGYGQARASLKQSYQAYGQSQAYLKVTDIEGFAQARASIKQAYQGFAQAATSIKASYQVFGQAATYILSFTNVFAQAQSIIKRTENSFAQAQGTILIVGSGSANAKAKIYPTPAYFSVHDSFTRTETAGWGTSDDAGDWTATVTSRWSVDGSSAVIKSGSSTTVNSLKNMVAPDNWWMVKYSFYVTTNDTSKLISILDGYGEVYNTPTPQFAGVGLSARLNNDSTATILLFRDGTQTTGSSLGTYTVSEWYHVRAFIYRRRDATVSANARMWRDGDPEPTTWVTASSTMTTVSPQGHMGIRVGSLDTNVLWDNLEISAPYFEGIGQAQATIKQSSTASANAQTSIIGVANAFGQAAAAIKNTYEVYAQAQSHIIVRGINSYAQANASIVKTESRFAQAQARIKTTYQVFANTQAWIKTTDIEGFAQARTSIKTTYRGFAQAQTHIVRAEQGFAQAIASIKTSYQAYGNALALIKQTYTGSANAQADIKATYAVFGQALATLSTVEEAFAQAQALVYQPVYYSPTSDVINNGWVRTVKN